MTIGFPVHRPQPNGKARLRPLVRIMLNMIVRLLADKMELSASITTPYAVYALNRRLVFCPRNQEYRRENLQTSSSGYDRWFPSTGKLEIIQESLAFLAGYGIRFSSSVRILTSCVAVMRQVTGRMKQSPRTAMCRTHTHLTVPRLGRAPF